MPSDGEIAPNAAAPTQVFACGRGDNRVTLSIDGDVLRIDIMGEALDTGIVESFREALAQGAIRPNMLTLVNLSDFAGSFDWATIHAIVELAPWGTEAGRASKVAYITKSAWFSAMMKVTSVLFPKTLHRQFSSVHYAQQWLHKD